MIQTVVKRDGRVVGFNEEKIIAAIRRAMLHTAQGEDKELASTIADRIASRGAAQKTVEEIQDKEIASVSYKYFYCKDNAKQPCRQTKQLTAEKTNDKINALKL